MRKFALNLSLAVGLFFIASIAHATVIMQTLPEFSFDGEPPFPSPEQVVGTFNFVIPLGEIIISASLAGTTGNSINGSSAAQDIFADGTLVGQCLGGADPCDTALFLGPSISSTLVICKMECLKSPKFRKPKK